MMIYRITDHMREHMFDNWSENKLRSMADDEGWTIPELKERLLEFAAFHDFDTLDGFLVGPGDKVNSISQLDGAPVDCDTFNPPQTPTMNSPRSPSSDDGESIFEAGSSVFTTPATPYTPATVKVTANGSPVKRGNNKYNHLMCQTNGLDGSTESGDRIQTFCEGFAIDADGQPIIRMFDPKTNLEHHAMDMDHLLHYNPDKKVVHLQGIEPSTGHLQSDPHMLVIYIEGVIYGDGQAGAAVFFHPLSPWNTVTWVEATEQDAKLEALYIALNMISITAANDPHLKAVRIRCAGRDFCLANTAHEHNLAANDRQAVTTWLQGASKTTLMEINELWADIAKGTNGHRAVDVRLWCVPEEEMQTVTDMALAYMYRQRGRDWYAENGKERPKFMDSSDSSGSLAYLQHYPIVAPHAIVQQGPRAIMKWKAEASARLRQSLLHKTVAADGSRHLNEQLRADGGELMSMERFLEAYAMATHYMSEDPQKDIDQFVADQRAIRLCNQLQNRQVTNVGIGQGESAGFGHDESGETLVREVLEMDWDNASTISYDNPDPYAQAPVLLKADAMNRRSIEPVSALPSVRGSKSQQGKWGSACAVCATAKAKCLRSSDDPGVPCDRCQRLGKDCMGQVHLPRKKRTPKASKTSQLEERLNGLVDLLRASGEFPSDGSRTRQSSSSQPEDEPGLGSSQGPSPASSSTAANVTRIPQSWNRHAPPRCICRAQTGDVPLQRRSDEELLAIYRNDLMPVFPFVVVLPDMTPERLKAERPFLFSAIRMAASISDVSSMRGQMFALTQQLTNEMMVESNRSMDLLHGILVMLAWYQNHCLMHAQLNNLLHLAQALLADLGLNRSPEVQERSNVMVLNPPAPNRTTNEDRRAILGVWFLSSSVATGLMKALPMRFSKYTRQCLEDLEKTSEYESDLLLVHLVKIQRLTERIHNWTSQEDDEDDISGYLKAPPAAYQIAFHGEIGRLQSSLPASLAGNRLLGVYFAFVTLHLNEPPPIEAEQLKRLEESLSSVALNGSSSLDALYRAQYALKGFFEKWFEMSTDFYTSMPIFVLLEVVYGMTMLARWAKLLGPGQARRGNTAQDILVPQKIVWDPSAVRPSPGTLFGAGLAPLKPFEANSETETRSKKISTASRGPDLMKLPPPITDPTQISASQFREVGDPTIPGVVASLRTKLHMQPGLNIDIIGILASLAERCEQVHRELTEGGAGGAWHNDVWYLCSKKVLITRAKLEKWAEIVAIGGAPTERATDPATKSTRAGSGIQVADSGNARQQRQTAPGGHQQPLYSEEAALAAFQKQMEIAGQGVWPPESTGTPWQFDSMWANDMFDSLDPALWLNDGNDWEMALLGPIQENQFGM